METLSAALRTGGPRRRQLLYPVVDSGHVLVGVATRNDLEALLHQGTDGDRRPFTELINKTPNVAHPDEPLRAVVFRMAETGLTRFPVVGRRSRRLLGMIGLFDLLKARLRNLEAERRRDRVLPVRLVLPRALTRRRSASIARRTG